MKDYLKVSYDEKLVPLTNYPLKLARYLFEMFDLKQNNSVLDVGAGRGEVAKGFKNLGLNVTCLDSSIDAENYAKSIGVNFIFERIKPKNKITIPDNSYDVIYTKSFVEHFEDSLFLFSEFYRILKPNGKLIVLTPDWQSNYKIFFDDITHVKPFIVESMKQILDLNLFKQIRVFTFRQLPITWKFKFIDNFCLLISIFVPVRTKIKFFRWSRELMLIGYGEKK